jgi:serine/threonine protein kinase
VHRDLKLENILVNSEMELKITDFGFATYYNHNKTKGYGGTLSYMAPEVSELKLYDGYKADIFSIGVILFITVIGNFPFPEGTKQDKYYSLLTSSKPERVSRYWSHVGAEATTEEFKNLFSRMVAYKASDRPSLEEIRQHPWMKMPIKTSDDKIKTKLIKSMKWKTNEQSLVDCKNEYHLT